MKTLRQQLIGWLLATACIATPLMVSAQPAPPPAPAAPPSPAQMPGIGNDASPNQIEWQRYQPVVRIGQDVHVAAGTTVDEVVVISGSAVIDGTVAGDVVVVLGSLRLGPAAEIQGDTVAVAGTVVVAPGARARGDLVVAGGAFDAPSNFTAGGEQVVVGATGLVDRVNSMIPWVTRGLLFGRLIVPSLGWMWGVIAVVFFVYLMIVMLFERPVRACAEVLAAKPLSTFLVGLLVLLLTGPVAFILVVSVVGIVVLPFALCALVIGWIVGKVAVSRAIGASILGEDEAGNKLHAARSFAIGFTLIMVAYMVPILGLMTFVLVGTFGLGSAWMALAAGLRRENPAKPRPVRPVPPPSVPTSTPPASYSPGTDAGLAGTSASAFADVPAYTPPPVAGYDVPSGAVPAAATAAAAATPGTLLAMPKAQLLVRAAAFGLDLILVLFVMAVFDIDDNGPRSFVLLLLIYHVVFWTLKATTVGGIVCNLRVIRTDGAPLGFSDAVIRGLASILSIIALGIGCLWIAYDPERQSWHDRIAGTYVVRVPRHWPL